MVIKTAALENIRAAVCINAVCPGVLKNPMIGNFTGKQKEAEQAFQVQELIGRFREPEEVAEAVPCLCSSEASFITGNVMAVDGGWIVQ